MQCWIASGVAAMIVGFPGLTYAAELGTNDQRQPINHQEIDLAIQDKHYYNATEQPERIRFDTLKYLAISGQGAPASQQFRDATSALYSIAYGIKAINQSEHCNFAVPCLEGLWWVANEKASSAPSKSGINPSVSQTVLRSEWYWKLLIQMPNCVTQDACARAKTAALRQNIELKSIENVRLEQITEDDSVQIMHIGPYSTEPETLKKVAQFMDKNELVKNGMHHEIYLSDPSKVEPTQLRTILRYPVKESKW